MNIKEGQVYVSKDYPGGPRYQILAIWDDYIWTHISTILCSKQPDAWKEPKTYTRKFYENCQLLYDLSR